MSVFILYTISAINIDQLNGLGQSCCGVANNTDNVECYMSLSDCSYPFLTKPCFNLSECCPGIICTGKHYKQEIIIIILMIYAAQITPTESPIIG